MADTLINYNKNYVKYPNIFISHFGQLEQFLPFQPRQKRICCFGVELADSKIFRGFYLEFSYCWARYYHINNMKTLLCLALVSLVIAPGFSSTCPLSASSQPKLYSDAVGLSSQSNNNGSTAQNLVYNYQFDSPFSSTPAVAIGFN